MNRGRGRNDIFHTNDDYLSFLKVIEESSIKFNALIHAYCLMSNHYHLIIETPEANLDRIMRHINGIYTQRYNKAKKTDGPLFRGRYKAILVEEENYLLTLTRYVHRNPIETKSRLVDDLGNYKWSSYPSYLNLCKSPDWLDKSRTLSKFSDANSEIRNYKSYVENDFNLEDDHEFIKSIFNKKNLPAILGGKFFKNKIYQDLDNEDSTHKDRVRINLNREISLQSIVNSISKTFNVSEDSILNRNSGRQSKNIPRSLAIYLCQTHKGLKLKQIAEIFGLTNVGSVSYALSTIKELLDKGDLKEEVRIIEGDLYLIQRT